MVWFLFYFIYFIFGWLVGWFLLNKPFSVIMTAVENSSDRWMWEKQYEKDTGSCVWLMKYYTAEKKTFLSSQWEHCQNKDSNQPLHFLSPEEVETVHKMLSDYFRLFIYLFGNCECYGTVFLSGKNPFTGPDPHKEMSTKLNI